MTYIYTDADDEECKRQKLVRDVAQAVKEKITIPPEDVMLKRGDLEKIKEALSAGQQGYYWGSRKQEALSILEAALGKGSV